MANKIITVKDGDKVIHEFVITEAQLNIAKKLGVGYKEYIVEKTRSGLEEKKSWADVKINLMSGFLKRIQNYLKAKIFH
jgi:hypothetical protein